MDDANDRRSTETALADAPAEESWTPEELAELGETAETDDTPEATEGSAPETPEETTGEPETPADPPAEPEPPAEDEAPAEDVTEPPVSPAERTALARLPDLGGVEAGLELPHGSIHVNGLSLTNPETSFEEWTEMGHRIGTFRRWSQFALGDWILFGEAIFGEDSAQATEAVASDRYDVANRVTGLQVATLQNYASICGRVPLSVRRVELDFSVHEPVAALERPDQIYWLDLAVVNGWSREELRAEIRAAKAAPADGDPADPVTTVVDPPLSIGERIEEAARLVVSSGQPTSEGGALVPPAPWSQLLASLGEE